MLLSSICVYDQVLLFLAVILKDALSLTCQVYKYHLVCKTIDCQIYCIDMLDSLQLSSLHTNFILKDYGTSIQAVCLKRVKLSLYCESVKVEPICQAVARRTEFDTIRNEVW